jgi:hypothetical protein
MSEHNYQTKHGVTFPSNTIKECLICHRKVNLYRSNRWKYVSINDYEYIDKDEDLYDFDIICLNKYCAEAYKLTELLE